MFVATHRRPAAGSAAGRRVFTVEHLAYVGLAALSILLHFWMLGGRALHHDETIHAYYSWLIYQKRGYIHDPLTHGPFLYYWTALQYALFGDTNFTARLGAAIFGVILTLLPWLLRSTIGRGAALIAAAYLVISPVALYVGRFIRHDIFAITFELLCLIAILRFMATRRVRWIYIFWAAFALQFVTIETSYLFTLTLGTFFLFVVLWQVDRRLLVPLAIFAVLAAGSLKLLPAHSGVVVATANEGGYQAVLGPDGQAERMDFPLVTEQQALVVRNQGDDRLLGQGGYFDVLGDTLFGSGDDTQIHTIKGRQVQGQNGVFLHAPISALVGLTVVFLAAMVYVIWFRRSGAGKDTMWKRAVGRAHPRSLLPALHALWSGHGLYAILLGLAIYVVFFTSFGMHTSGIVSGVTGSLLYWVAQHDVERGGQPQHYYFVQLLVYEPWLLFVGLGAMVAGVVALVRNVLTGAALTARRMAPGLLAWWAGGSVALYTWAGEKMPWITLHLVAPLTIIAAWGFYRLVRWMFAPSAKAKRRGGERQALTFYLTLIFATAFIAILMLTRSIRPQGEAGAGSEATPLLVGGTLALWLLLTLAYGAWHGFRRATGALIIALTCIWSVYSFRSAWKLNFINGDVPVEMMVYVQTSPDVARVLADLEEISVAETGKMDLPIMNDNEQIWKWYTRNFVRKVEFNGAMGGAPSEDIAAMLIIDSNWGANSAFVEGFVEGRYPLRWWFPEDRFYRFSTVAATDASGVAIYEDGELVMERGPFEQDSTIGKLVRRPWDSQTQNELWRYLLFRQPPAAISSVDFKIYVRPEYAFMLRLPTTAVTGDQAMR